MKMRKSTVISKIEEQNMEKKSIIKIIKELLLKIVKNILFVIILFETFIVLRLHIIATFLPILFLFDFCLLIGYPIFLRYVLKKKWFECTKDDYLCIRYIMFPLLIMELAVLFCYPQETVSAIDFWAESNFLK